MAKTNTSQAIESLAAEIGNNVYIDIAKWHLYLREAHLHTVVAERVYPILEDNSLSESKVLQILADIPVKIGGKRDLPLADLIPTASQVNLMDILEEFQRNM
ncbi:thylakoid-associated protein [[Phormidium ambiguum] IAM M-71]|uniref:Thylakoid-associated protein n=1 Tax=[Phormidium ambiguum] IAM M-71 TaxID=454136 RepID=A0A1U7IRZ1_9CYAN|nr:DUF3181 family protein [Phormidium ambiguum]OKH40166.1 thylakoid-associated protein [Phormidium ambiguum IAM M-71]